MRRALVLTDESARHPFRASLPPHVRRLVDEDGASPAEWLRTLRQRDMIAGIPLGDVRDFLLAYCAAFVAVSLFIW